MILSMTKLSNATVSIIKFTIKTLIMLSVILPCPYKNCCYYDECHYNECCVYAECHYNDCCEYAECHYNDCFLYAECHYKECCHYTKHLVMNIVNMPSFMIIDGALMLSVIVTITF